MFRSQGEKISSVRIITVLPANVPVNFIFSFPHRARLLSRRVTYATCEKRR